MKIGSPFRFPSLRNWRNTNGNGRVMLSKSDRSTLRNLQRVWLETALRVLNGSEGPSSPVVLGVTSASRGEGKTVNCLGLASALARESGERVLIVECELGNSGLASKFDLDASPGLVEVVNDGNPIEGSVRKTAVENLDIAVIGGHREEDDIMEIWSHPASSQFRRRLPGMLANLKEYYGYIVLDLPPMLTNAYTREMLKATDGVFLSVKAGVTPIDDMLQASQNIGAEKMMGVILGDAASAIPQWVQRILHEV